MSIYSLQKIGANSLKKPLCLPIPKRILARFSAVLRAFFNNKKEKNA
tara:strand:- start:189 stop:329 length:141 start_codon:yes stop_codon:yes gene_type:complete